eukprot:gene982-1384_t
MAVGLITEPLDAENIVANGEADFLADDEEEVCEDVKADAGEKALVTFHTVAFEGSIGFVNMLQATRLQRKGFATSILLSKAMLASANLALTHNYLLGRLDRRGQFDNKGRDFANEKRLAALAKRQQAGFLRWYGKNADAIGANQRRRRELPQMRRADGGLNADALGVSLSIGEIARAAFQAIGQFNARRPLQTLDPDDPGSR